MKSMSMISSAIQSSLVMIPIILIVHLLLKHFLLDKVNNEPKSYNVRTDKNQKTKTKKIASANENCESDDETEDFQKKEVLGKTPKSNDSNVSNDSKVEKSGFDMEDEEAYLRRRLSTIQEKRESASIKKNPPNFTSQSVKIQNRRPVLDPSTTKVTPSSEDVYSFVLEGEPSLGGRSNNKNNKHDREFEDNSVKTKANSFFSEPHTPISVSDQQKFFQDEKLFSVERDGDMYQNTGNTGGSIGEDMKDMKVMNDKYSKAPSDEYSDAMFTKQGVGSTDLFNNIDAANFEDGQSSLDEIFRQTQVAVSNK